MMAGGGVKVEPRHSSPLPSLPSTLQRVLPRTIPGPVSPQNKGALDWGWQGFLAYGAQTTVVVVDPVTLQCAQTLSKHRNHVVKVRWRKSKHYHQLSAPYSLALASADSGGTILVWEVVRGEVVATLQDGTKGVLELEWLGGVDGSEHLLAALHPPYSLVLWDTRHSTRVWRKSYTETLTAFHFDPFHSNKMAFLCGGCVLFVEDFSLAKCPSSNGRKFYVSAPRTSPGRGAAGQSTPAAPSSAASTPSGPAPGAPMDERASSKIRRKMRELVVGESKPSRGEDGSGQLVECLQLAYHRTVRDQLLLLHPREILILDLTINQTVGIVAVDRAVSPFCQVLSCWQRDVLLCLHESGSVSAHFRRRLLPLAPSSPDESSGVSADQQYFEVMYDRKCHSEPLRLNRLSRPIGLTLDPVTERQMALVLGDGRVVFKQLQISPTPGRQAVSTPLFTPGHPTPPAPPQNPAHPPSGLTISDDHFGGALTPGAAGGVGGQPSPPPPKLTLGDLVKPAWALKENVKDTIITTSAGTSHKINLRIIMTGLMPSVSPPPLVVRMCPPLTTRNMHSYLPRMAAGTQSGAVQIFNMATGMLEREFALHTYPVRGVEWASLSSILSFGHQPLTNGQGLVRNELVYTDTLTGRSTPLRTNKAEESSIDMVRVSYLKQYFLVVLRDDPLELWDARRLLPLRTMPRRFPRVSALEWSPTSHVKAPRVEDGAGAKGDVMTDSTLSLVDVGTPTSTTAPPTTTANTSTTTPSIAKETFVFTDSEGQLYHFSVEGNVIKDGSKVPPDSQMSTITSIAWKSHEIVLSDADGNLTVWDLKTRISRHIATHRGWVRKVRFAPGRDNMKLLVLFADGIDVWDVRDVVLVSQIKTPKDMVKIVDADWGASDRPILATVDGCLRVMDMGLKVSNSPLHHYCTKEPIVSPYLLGGEASLNLRTLLTHQPWRSPYSLSFTTEDGFTPEELSNIEIWLSRIPQEVRAYLEGCESTAHRALVVSQLFGDQGELDFWTVAAHYLTHPPMPLLKEDASSSSSSVGSAEILTLGDISSNASDDPPCSAPPSSTPASSATAPTPPLHPLETTYHHLCDAATYKHHELERLAIHESKGLEGEQRAALGRSLAMVGERDRAVRLLLDADASHSHFYTDCLRACLLSATHHSPQAQSTIKLVATNLIAAGNIWEGVELLCLIGKAGDACRYLQSYGQWLASVWLAKCALPVSETVDILRRWAHHLVTTGNKDQGVCVLLSIGSVASAIEQLVTQHYHQRAALLLSAANQHHALPQTQTSPPSGAQVPAAASFVTTASSSFQPMTSTASTSPTLSSSSTSSSGSSTSGSLASLTENIHRKYVLHLYSLGNQPAVTHFCRLLGEKGHTLLQELDALQ